MAGVAALTGATGFIGNRLTQRLLADGWRVRSVSRSLPASRDKRIEWQEGDLVDPRVADDLVADADVVVHCAGTVSAAKSSGFISGNVDTTRSVAEAVARQPGRARLIYLSSLAARYPGLSPYARSKRLAEDAITANADDIPWTILRPTAVYGPGDRAMLPIFHLLVRGWLPVPGPWAARVTLLHVDDLIAAVVAGLDCSAPPRGCFELDDGTDGGYSWWTIAACAEQALDRRVRFLPLPRSVLYMAGGVNQALARMVGYDPVLTPGKVRELGHDDWRCDYRPYREITGWWPRIGLAEAIRQKRLGI